MNGRNVQATGRVFTASSSPARRQDHGAHCIGENTMTDLSRRAVIKATGAVGASILPAGLTSNKATAQEARRLPAAAGASSSAQPTTYLFFNPEEAAFIEAAVARLIPADDKWPGALEAGVPNYIDKQLNGAWGAGE